MTDLSSVAGEESDNFFENGRLNKAAYTTWAGKLGIGERAAGIAFDSMAGDNEYMGEVDQGIAWQ